MDSNEMIRTLERASVEGIVLRGNNVMARCPSPSHDDSNPSWGISLDAPHLHCCFGCGFKGTLFTLLKYHSKIPLNEIYVIAGKPEAETKKLWDDSMSQTEMYDQSSVYPFSFTDECRAYAAKRKIRATTFEKVGILYDHHTESILVPWYDKLTLMGVTSKSLKGGSMMPLLGFKKSGTLYVPGRCLHPSSPVIIVEGEFDALKVYDAGYTNVAALGFGVMSKEQETLLVNCGAKEFILFLDDDPRGRKLSREIANRLGKLRRVHKVEWQGIRLSHDKLDPGKMTRTGIRAMLKNRVKRSANWRDF